MASRKGSNTGLVVLMAISAAVAGGLVAYIRTAPADKVPADIRRVETPPAPVVSEATEVKMFVPRASGADVVFDSESTTVPKGEDPQVFAVNSFLKATTIVKPEARLLSVDIHNGIADLHFNADFNETVGTGDEKTLLDGIRFSMGQFAGVEKVAFYSDGKKMETLGNVDLSEPVTVLSWPPEVPKTPPQG